MINDWFLNCHHWDSALGDRRVEQEVEFIRAALSLQPQTRLLDIPTGNGRLAVPLARHCRVTGIDIRSDFIEEARQRCRRENVEAEFHVGDMRDLGRWENGFDAALNWFGSFGYFTDEENIGTLRSMVRTLVAGGCLLIDFLNREFATQHLVGRMEIDGGVLVNEWDERTERLCMTFPGDDVGFLRLYTQVQINDLMGGTGLQVLQVYGSEYGGAFTPESKRYVVLARRAPA